MTKTEIEHALAECAAQVLERMFFVCIHRENEPTASEVDSEWICEVGFAGEPSGHLGLGIGRKAASLIAADFLGEDQASLSGLQIGQVVCELANMVCGAVLSRIESGTTFRLDSPRLLPAWRSSGADAAVRLVIPEAGILNVIFSAERPVCPMSA